MYTTKGKRSGSCGHRHYSIYTAAMCARRHGGDRKVIPCKGTRMDAQDRLEARTWIHGALSTQ